MDLTALSEEYRTAADRLQERLRDIARAGGSIPLIAADGVFGPATREAVQALQRQLGLEETGAVGPVLWAEIMTRGPGY